MLKKIALFWKSYKKTIILIAGFTPVAVYLPIAVPLADTVAEEIQAAESQPGQSQDESK